MDTEAAPPRDPYKQVIVIRRDLKMRRGKEIAQGAHASSAWIVELVNGALDAATRTGTVTVDPTAFAWMTSSWRKVTLQVHTEEQLLELDAAARARGLRTHLVKDSGRTEFGGVATFTALAIGPDLADEIDAVTGDLPIY